MIVALLACVASGSPEGGDGMPPGEDGASYDEQAAALAATRVEFLGEDGAGAILADGDRLWWVDDSQWDFGVASWDAGAPEAVRYPFTIGDSYENFRPSAGVVATAREDGGTIAYPLYAAGRSGDALGELELPAPTDGQRWYAYATFDDALWLVVTSPEARLQRWAPGDAQPRTELAFADLGVDVGEFWEFGLDAEHLVFVESGRVWSVDLAAGAATWLENEQLATGSVDLRDDGVLFQTEGDQLWYWSYAEGAVRALHEEIAAGDYRVDAAHEHAHWPYELDFCRWERWVIYQALSGIFAYHLDTGEIVPLLLEDGTADYFNPQALADGTIFVESVVSADGPIYRLDTDALR